MEYGAIHLRRSQYRLVTADGMLVQEGKCATTRADLTRVFGDRAPAQLLVESSTESEWVAQHLEGLGHTVIVADPNYAPMYGARSRRVKTDGRDAAALTEACRVGVYRRAHRVSATQRARRQHLRIRRRLVQMRSGTMSVLRAILRQEGYRLPSGSVEAVDRRVEALAMAPPLLAIVDPLRQLLRTVTALVQTADAECAVAATTAPVPARLMTAPGVGPIVALSFYATLDAPGRFDGNAARASAFLGLVPSEASSGERRRKGHITKTGPTELRALLIQASWVIWRSRSPETAALRTWATRLAERRGRRIAIVALARRLSRILFAMWRDATEFSGRRQPSAA